MCQILQETPLLGNMPNSEYFWKVSEEKSLLLEAFLESSWELEESRIQAMDKAERADRRYLLSKAYRALHKQG